MSEMPSVTELAKRLRRIVAAFKTAGDDSNEEAQNLADALIDIHDSCRRMIPAIERAVSARDNDEFGDGFLELALELNHVVTHVKASAVLRDQVDQL